MSVSRPWLPVAPSANVKNTSSFAVLLAVRATSDATEAAPVIVFAFSVSTVKVSADKFNFSARIVEFAISICQSSKIINLNALK